MGVLLPGFLGDRACPWGVSWLVSSQKGRPCMDAARPVDGTSPHPSKLPRNGRGVSAHALPSGRWWLGVEEGGGGSGGGLAEEQKIGWGRAAAFLGQG